MYFPPLLCINLILKNTNKSITNYVESTSDNLCSVDIDSFLHIVDQGWLISTHSLVMLSDGGMMQRREK